MKILRMSRYKTKSVALPGLLKSDGTRWFAVDLIKPFRRPLFGYRRK